ncbi:hypothetical protein WN55_03709 [Dufourea novaeangliae]|uniref:Uncharacterized protein n=1 Tax=Dufourea novaeangliae TaxID=178035 RepID=A0A154PK28_DUFNO|nr:hypothetical protein WN55_03709 [Dufourea novaeangliae]
MERYEEEAEDSDNETDPEQLLNEWLGELDSLTVVEYDTENPGGKGGQLGRGTKDQILDGSNSFGESQRSTEHADDFKASECLGQTVFVRGTVAAALKINYAPFVPVMAHERNEFARSVNIVLPRHCDSSFPLSRRWKRASDAAQKGRGHGTTKREEVTVGTTKTTTVLVGEYEGQEKKGDKWNRDAVSGTRQHECKERERSHFWLPLVTRPLSFSRSFVLFLGLSGHGRQLPFSVLALNMEREERSRGEEGLNTCREGRKERSSRSADRIASMEEVEADGMR